MAWSTPATFSTVAPGKRHREAEEPQGDGGLVGIHTHELPPLKRARGAGKAKGILKAARSAARTRQKPAARIPKQMLNGKPKKAGRGAERLATSNSQGIYHQLLPGPSFQQGWTVEPAEGQPTWVEGSVDEGAAHRTDGTVQQQQQEEVTVPIQIPRIFKPRHRMLLQASEADFARGVVQEIKCRLCPDTKLKNFQQFKRHCNTREKHPLEINFCDQCGDFFARSDSLRRHRDQPPEQCRKVTPEEAAQKRRATEEAHEEFIRKLEQGLKTEPFSQDMKERYPESSKKDRRQ